MSFTYNREKKQKILTFRQPTGKIIRSTVLKMKNTWWSFSPATIARM
jgi:hypothetical protein